MTLVSARAQLSSPGSCQSNPLLGAASPWQWDPQSSRSSIDLDRLKLHRVSHFCLLSAHPLEKRTGEAAEMCYSMALFSTDISVVDLLGSYKHFFSFSRATRTVLGHREQQMDLQWEQLPLLEAQAQRTGVCRNFDRVLLPKNLLWVVCKRPCSSSDVD